MPECCSQESQGGDWLLTCAVTVSRHLSWVVIDWFETLSADHRGGHNMLFVTPRSTALLND